MLPSDYYDAKLLARNMWERQSAAADVDNFDIEHAQELAKCALLLDDFAGDIYKKWQKLGGTSDIKSVALHRYYEIAKLEELHPIECDQQCEDVCRHAEAKELKKDEELYF